MTTKIHFSLPTYLDVLAGDINEAVTKIADMCENAGIGARIHPNASGWYDDARVPQHTLTRVAHLLDKMMSDALDQDTAAVRDDKAAIVSETHKVRRVVDALKDMLRTADTKAEEDKREIDRQREYIGAMKRMIRRVQQHRREAEQRVGKYEVMLDRAMAGRVNALHLATKAQDARDELQAEVDELRAKLDAAEAAASDNGTGTQAQGHDGMPPQADENTQRAVNMALGGSWYKIKALQAVTIDQRETIEKLEAEVAQHEEYEADLNKCLKSRDSDVENLIAEIEMNKRVIDGLNWTVTEIMKERDKYRALHDGATEISDAQRTNTRKLLDTIAKLREERRLAEGAWREREDELDDDLRAAHRKIERQREAYRNLSEKLADVRAGRST